MAPEQEASEAAGGPARAQVLCDVRAAVAAAAADGTAGILWKLAEGGRQLDANLVRLAPGAHVPAHAEPDLDVLVLVVAGTGELATGPSTATGTARTGTPEATGGAAGEAAGDAGGADPDVRPLAEGALVWLPRGATRSFTAGEDGLSYVTVHQRRPGMRIGRRPGA